LGSHARVTANSRHSPGTPFRSRIPRSSNSISEPATRSLTVDDTRTSPAAACAETCPRCAQRWRRGLPPRAPPRRCAAPRATSMPSVRTPPVMAAGHRMARAGPSNIARKPSPVVFTSRPRKYFSALRTIRLCSAIRFRHRPSPISAARYRLFERGIELPEAEALGYGARIGRRRAGNGRRPCHQETLPLYPRA
jgi:hypothetical protein